jgi:hypothetical protein
MNQHDFFISGYVRSGTTLLDKLLSNHSCISALSQALPSIFIAIKKRFLKKINVDDYYSLSHYCGENRYSPSDFLTFLNNELVSVEFISDALNNGYSGQYTKISIDPNLKNMTFIEWYRILVCENRHKLNANVFGDKEVLCEEYVPYFINNEIKVVHIIRNPMDVVNSIYFGKGDKYVGSIKPILFTLHNWRKSAQLALQFSTYPNFLLVHYEKLVTNKRLELKSLFSFLEVENETDSILSDKIRDQTGEIWLSNSSFQPTNNVNGSRVGNYHRNLSSSLIEYINFICYPELEQLSYDVLSGDGLDIINKFSEPFNVNDQHIRHDYSCNNEIKEIEIERLKKYFQGDYRMEFDCKINNAL